ncbi:hypothetical protein DI09_34p30 [Mitosporidium daphniae]|uniref:Uncharacterized protein n=1 Tax=Mitosporidium daphniae TaxID=1485682 RepID=A0A098VR06_9MICR|nr:uncharacterized protein DI09_34p30 [Mitosporidium daphniae]KGG51452.1 hypothetical protein DI09_34p30 [Mitosporidium daphniae]|eukprot:XP_013237906.1 uncharacterized protein DI09_34p30 [Mitosporidium daphniae]
MNSKLRLKVAVDLSFASQLVQAIDEKARQVTNSKLYWKNNFKLTMLAACSSSARSTDRFSEALGEKLLQGWAMLDSSCPKCPSIPLMRPRNSEELYCVSCKAYISASNSQAASECLNMKSENAFPVNSFQNQEAAAVVTNALSILQISIAKSLETDAQFMGTSSSSLDAKTLSNVEMKLKLIQMAHDLYSKIK